MAGKVSAKNGTILIGGYSLSPYAFNYEIGGPRVTPLEITGFQEPQNFIPGLVTSDLSINLYWDNTANSVNDALKGLGNKAVTIIPETYALGVDALSMYAMQANFSPQGSTDTAVRVESVSFHNTGDSAGVMAGWMLQNGTITTTTTGTGFDDPLGAAVTAECKGILHIWTPCAADTYVVKIQHSTALGSGYADLITFTSNGSARTSEMVSVASGTVNRYRRIVATRTGSAGNTFGFSVFFWHA